jgi:shikimate dehydrogenase
MKYGLLGAKLSHSFSKNYFENKYPSFKVSEDTYDLIESEENKLKLTFEAIKEAYDGINVTIPYKEKIIPFLDHIEENALEIGALNCIHFKDKKSYGYNTDYLGFIESLNPLVKPNQFTSAYVLGTGGASKAVLFALKNHFKIPRIIKISRNSTNGNTYEDIMKMGFENNSIVINTTPLGMYPNIELFPLIPYNSINETHFFMDLIYNPEETIFLSKAKEKKAGILNGLKMLEIQADRSYDIWKK